MRSCRRWQCSGGRLRRVCVHLRISLIRTAVRTLLGVALMRGWWTTHAAGRCHGVTCWLPARDCRFGTSACVARLPSGQERSYCTDILDAAALRLAAASLSHYARASRGVPALDELRATRETYGARTGTGSLSAARSAIEQLRQHAWRHARSEHVSIRTLGTYAALANTIYQHAAVIADAGAARAAQLRLGADPAVITTRLQRSSELSVAAATSWRDVRLACTALRTTTVPAAELYELVLVVRTGLESVTRDSDGWRLGTAILPDRDEAQRIFTDIRMLIAPMEEISAWHGVAVATLAETGSLYMSAGDVDREQLSEDHTLAAALLSRRPVPLPQRQTVELLEAFARADDATWAVAKASAAANFYGHLQRPAFSTMRQMHRAAGRPAIGL